MTAMMNYQIGDRCQRKRITDIARRCEDHRYPERKQRQTSQKNSRNKEIQTRGYLSYRQRNKEQRKRNYQSGKWMVRHSRAVSTYRIVRRNRLWQTRTQYANGHDACQISSHNDKYLTT